MGDDWIPKPQADKLQAEIFSFTVENIHDIDICKKAIDEAEGETTSAKFITICRGWLDGIHK